jgi:hypothetical protein
MATWKGKIYQFKLETYPPGCYGAKWANVDFFWEYSTTSDMLTVYEKAPHQEKATEILFSQESAVANLVTMMDWYAVYNGQEALDKLVADLKKEYSDE